MRNIRLDSVLLFALLVPFIMNYRISPGTTPYWLFGLIFAGLLSYVSLDLFSLREKTRFLFKSILLTALIIGSIGATSYSEIIVRHQSSPTHNIHDIIIQQESAIRFLLHGQNPYATNYFGTPLEDWHYSDTEVNPALYHFVMQPFFLIFAIPFYLISTRTIGFFDGRMPLVFLFAALIVSVWFFIKDKQKRLEFIILLAFNPATLGYFIEGRDDIFMFPFLFLGLILLYKKRFSWAGVPMALAFAVKQSVWPIFPFYFFYLYFSNKNIKETVKQLLPFTAVFSAIVLPFAFWNLKAFLDSTILYLSGNVANSYPISGYGFGMFLNDIEVIKDVHSYFPFWIIQTLICFPLVVVLFLWQKKNNTVVRLILSYGIFLFVFWYLSRYFNNSHLGYISMIFITAYFWPPEN
ncbi:MAG: hypothetical protein WD992_03235 [Candidatus Levyibacteriota bacterium]